MRKIIKGAFVVSILLGSFFALRGSTGRSGWPLKPVAAGAKPVSTAGVLVGIYPAGSHVKDWFAPGMYGPNGNYPFDLNGRVWGTPGELSIAAFPDDPVDFFGHRGLGVVVVNNTGGTVGIAALDSCLPIVAEALHPDGDWRAVESPVRPICSQSYHRVFLKPRQFWQFPAREYAGDTKSKLRYRLDCDGRAIYSNEFDGRVNLSQFVAAEH